MLLNTSMHSEMYKNASCLGLGSGSFGSSTLKPWIPLTSVEKIACVFITADTCKGDHDSIAKIAQESHHLDSR